MFKNAIISLLILSGCFVSAGAQETITPQQKLQYAEFLIDKFYVDKVDEGKIVESAIVAMLKELDPHSQYSDAEETRALTEPLSGNFSGIGIQFNMSTDTVYVIQTIAGGPSERVGILAGDKIVSANDTVIAGRKMKNSDIIKRLRGPKGSVVELGVVRRGVADTLAFRVVRDDIPIHSVDASYMIDGRTGYVRISRFGETTAEELKVALEKLVGSGMQDLILDLQDNGGGYLKAATDIAEMFLKRGDDIVCTKGMNVAPQKAVATRDGKYRNGRLVVLVNQISASASEIMSGAVQDNDRGVIVGRRTFGKGLVQRPFPMPDGSMIRLTIARYYTPSGRCIQKPYRGGEEDDYNADLLNRYKHGEFSSVDSVHFADSLLSYTCKLRRPVYGGGGIMPDRFVPIDTTMYSDYYRDLVAKGLPYRYCLEYIDNNRKQLKTEYPDVDKFVKEFVVTPEMVDAMVAFGEREGVAKNADQLAVSLPMIETVMKAYLARDLFDESAFYRIANPLNPIYNEGVRIIGSNEYKKILTASKR